MLEYLFYRASYFFANKLPVKVSYAIALFIADLWFSFAKNDRRAVIENLSVILDKKPQSRAIFRLSREVFRNFAKYIIDFLRFPKIDRGWIDRKVKIKGMENLTKALSHQRGAICVTAHVGNWELGGAVTAMHGFMINAIALTHRDKRVDDFFVKQRKDKNVNVIALGGALNASIKALQRREVLALLGDRDFSKYGIKVMMFNRPAIVPKGPAILHLKTSAPMLIAHMVRCRGDNFELTFSEPIIYNKTSDKKEDISNVTALVASCIEGIIRQYPTQWYMFLPFWVEG